MANVLNEEGGEGLRVVMMAEQGITEKGYLPSPFYFQLPPLEELTVEHGHDHTTYTTVSKGTFSRSSGRTLAALSFETLILDYDPNWAVRHGNPDPLDAAKDLRDITEKGTPFRLVIHQAELWGEPDYNMLAVITNLGVSERHGEQDARYFTLGFQEWRDAELKRKKKGKIKLPANVVVDRFGRAKKLKGDDANRPATIAMIVQEYYGKSRYSKLVKSANKRLATWPNNRSLGEFVVQSNRGEPFKIKLPEKPGKK